VHPSSSAPRRQHDNRTAAAHRKIRRARTAGARGSQAVEGAQGVEAKARNPARSAGIDQPMTRKPSPKPRVSAKARKPAPAPAAKRPAHRPVYEASDKDRLTVKVMVAGGIEQTAIAGVLGISGPTLRKHFRREINTGMAEISAQVVSSLITMAIGRPGRRGTDTIPAQAAMPPNFNAAKWYSQARMGWQEHIIVDDGKPADTPMRVIVEFVGEAAAPRVDQSAPRTGSRLPDDIRKHVQLVG
jgi:hypothetical protein